MVQRGLAPRVGPLCFFFAVLLRWTLVPGPLLLCGRKRSLPARLLTVLVRAAACCELLARQPLWVWRAISAELGCGKESGRRLMALWAEPGVGAGAAVRLLDP